ncbi:signal peptidase I [Parabacteroides sp. OttesenSCG-928-J18]|nr:signal peptidase I [Parabacteroides sp. OttesenSCG-928-J18]
MTLSVVWKWIIALAIAFAGILALRQWVVASYSISTPSMENTLQEGDYLLVYKGKKQPGRNQVVLFTSPLRQADVKPALLISRCLGLPGDTLFVMPDGFLINGHMTPHAPQSLHTWLVMDHRKNSCLDALQRLRIDLREWARREKGYSLRLTSFEAWQVMEEMGEKEALQRYGEAAPYRLIVPRKGRTYPLDEQSLLLCAEAIRQETNGKAQFREGKLYLDGREVSAFAFKKDYYWMISDNPEEAVDSRHLGFIPEDHIQGVAGWCWYSKDRSRIFKPVH